MSPEMGPTDVRNLFAEARALAGGRPGGALRLMLMRLRQNRAEDAGVRSTVGRVLTIEDTAPSQPAPTLAQLMRRRGYRQLGANGRVWVHDATADRPGSGERG